MGGTEVTRTTPPRWNWGWGKGANLVPVPVPALGGIVTVPSSSPYLYMGSASVKNRICMSTLHHAAFDTHLIGVDPEFRIHTSPTFRKRRGGNLLATLSLEGPVLRLPSDPEDWPDLAFLEQRFAPFESRPAQ